jgi:hypothetical protein
LNVLGTDTHKFDLKFHASIKSDLTVYAFLEVVIWVLLNSVPLDNGRVNLVNYFQENLAVSAIFEEIVDVDILKI